MTGPEHYREGERLLAESEDTSTVYKPDEAHTLAAQANAHFLAALVAAITASQHPESIAWEQAINPTEAP